MKKTVLLLAVVCVAAGCGGLDYKEGIKVNVRSGESLPVQVEPQGAEGLPVRLNVQYDKPLPIKIEIPKEIIAALILTAVIVLAAIAAAVYSLLSVRAVIRSIAASGRPLKSEQPTEEKDDEKRSGG